MIPVRTCKMLLLAAIAFFFTLVAFNNLTDFDSNYQFVRHVLMMDSTFPGNHGMWRAIRAPWIHVAFYLGIIAWEILNAVLGWWGCIALFRALRSPEARVPACQAARRGGANLWNASVVHRVSVHRRRVVPHVAIEALEWSGRSLPHVCRRGPGLSDLAPPRLTVLGIGRDLDVSQQVVRLIDCCHPLRGERTHLLAALFQPVRMPLADHPSIGSPDLRCRAVLTHTKKFTSSLIRHRT